MRYLLIGIIKLYQLIPFSLHTKCRYIPTCSEYFILSLKEYGTFKGTYLGIKRILRCAPWGGMGYDPIPERNKK